VIKCKNLTFRLL